MRETKLPPVGAMRRHGTRIALATDNNPGTSPTTSLLLMLNMGATLFGLTVVEALRGVTVNSAAALGLSNEIDTIEPGKASDLALLDVTYPPVHTHPIVVTSQHQRLIVSA